MIDQPNCFLFKSFMKKKFTFLLFFTAITFFSKTIAQTTYPTIHALLASGTWATLTADGKPVLSKTALPGQNKTTNEVVVTKNGNYTISIKSGICSNDFCFVNF